MSDLMKSVAFDAQMKEIGMVVPPASLGCCDAKRKASRGPSVGHWRISPHHTATRFRTCTGTVSIRKRCFKQFPRRTISSAGVWRPWKTRPCSEGTPPPCLRARAKDRLGLRSARAVIISGFSCLEMSLELDSASGIGVGGRAARG